MQAILTRRGRTILADNSQAFKITKYRFSDDEINYTQYDGSSIDAANTTILSTPILEGCSNEIAAAQRYDLLSLAQNTLQLATLDTNLKKQFVDGSQFNRIVEDTISISINYDRARTGSRFPFLVRTYYGNDQKYFFRSENKGIISPSQDYYDSVSSTDPTQTFQNQTQAKLVFVVTITPDTIVNVGRAFRFADIGRANITLVITGSNTKKQYLIDVDIFSPSLIISARERAKKEVGLGDIPDETIKQDDNPKYKELDPEDLQ